ncbi:hypothetical protein FRC10_006041 [Ceratobasidium sp. 414]|nr:hypothetical protein FRC10_006041 [Ceratobasidium sp. 414]
MAAQRPKPKPLCIANTTFASLLRFLPNLSALHDVMLTEVTVRPMLNLVETHTQLENTKYFTLVSYTLLCYDILICLGDEITFIWSNRWSLGRVVYHMTRVLPLIVLSTSAITSFGYLPSQSMFVQGCWLGFCLCMCIVYAYHLSHRHYALLGAVWTGDAYPVVSLCIPLVSMFHRPQFNAVYF